MWTLPPCAATCGGRACEPISELPVSTVLGKAKPELVLQPQNKIAIADIIKKTKFFIFSLLFIHYGLILDSSVSFCIFRTQFVSGFVQSFLTFN
jgi:hypothetical protein